MPDAEKMLAAGCISNQFLKHEQTSYTKYGLLVL